MECYHIIKKSNGSDIYKQILAKQVIQYPVPTSQFQLLNFHQDVVNIQQKERQETFMSMDPAKFTILHYKKP